MKTLFTATATALAASLLVAPSLARADDGHRGWNGYRGGYAQPYGAPQYRHQHPPRRYYAPPPQVYYGPPAYVYGRSPVYVAPPPPPVVVYPRAYPQPGVSIGFGFQF